jgi:ribosome-associated toxin RatA of RatAB toxin-antitoxin module
MLTRSRLIRRGFFGEPDTLKHTQALYFNKSPYTVFKVISDIDKYKEFIPWCTSSYTYNKKENSIASSITIGYAPLTLTYIANVDFEFPHKIHSASNKNAVFDLHESLWQFYPDGQCLKSNDLIVPVDKTRAMYSISFRFTSATVQSFTQLVFDQVIKETANAFQKHINSLKEDEPCFYNKQTKTYYKTKEECITADIQT